MFLQACTHSTQYNPTSAEYLTMCCCGVDQALFGAQWEALLQLEHPRLAHVLDALVPAVKEYLGCFIHLHAEGESSLRDRLYFARLLRTLGNLGDPADPHFKPEPWMRLIWIIYRWTPWGLVPEGDGVCDTLGVDEEPVHAVIRRRTIRRATGVALVTSKELVSAVSGGAGS
jgi:hypothetical protein